MRPTWIFCLDNGPRRVNHSAVMIDQRIFMFGGYCSGEDYETIKCIDIHTFNTVSHVWKKVHCRNKELDLKFCNQPSEVPYMRYGHASVAIRDEVYLFGGRNESLGACKTLYSFNTNELKWHIPPVGGFNPGARDGHAMCVARGNIYLFGGYEAEAERFSDETFLLDMQSMVWTLVETKGVQPRWRDFHTITAHDDKIYLFGGRGDVFGPFPSNSELYDNELRVLDLDTSSWSTPAKRDQKMPIGRRSHTAFFHKGCLYVFGGYNSDKNEHFNDLWKYDPVTDLWSSPITDGSVPSGRRRHCCCYSDNKVFIFGGTSPCLRKNEENNNETSRKIDGLSLYDHSDTYMLDFGRKLSFPVISIPSHSLIQLPNETNDRLHVLCNIPVQYLGLARLAIEPSLKTLCINAVLKNNLDISCLPNDLFHSRPTLSRG